MDIFFWSVFPLLLGSTNLSQGDTFSVGSRR